MRKRKDRRRHSRTAKDIEKGITSLALAAGDAWQNDIYTNDPAEAALYELAGRLAEKGLAAKLGQLLIETAQEFQQAT